MYRLVLYVLTAFVIVAAILGFAGKLPFSGWAILGQWAFLVAICWIVNETLAKLFKVPANVESVYITAFILSLLITPSLSIGNLMFCFWAGLIAMASKYLIAWQRKHIFNPTAFALVVTAFALGQSAGWWIANSWMLPFVIIGGVLIVRKIKRFDLVISFFLTSIATTLIFGFRGSINLAEIIRQYIFILPTFFFAFIMLTEPLTTPPTKKWQMVYGALVGILFAPQWHIGNYYSTPEIALVLGNIFSYIVSPKAKLLLILKDKLNLAPSINQLIFVPDRTMAFQPGQYLEWTLPANKPDTRGNRRYFTIASSPTESTIQLGVKFYEPPSTFKRDLKSLVPGQTILAGQLAGDFTLPKDPTKKLIFIAGGIGITPFRSMLKYLLDTKQTRPITLLYSNRTVEDIVYKDILDRASQEMGIKVIYALTDKNVPADWTGRTGFIDAAAIKQEAPGYQHSLFYLSGPRSMVTAFEQTLASMNVPKNRIKTDFFPGYV